MNYKRLIKIEASEGEVPTKINVLNAGEFNTTKYGPLSIASDVLVQMVENFDKQLRAGETLPIDAEHYSDQGAYGWIKSLELSDNNTKLWANVDWNAWGLEALGNKVYKFFSPEFTDVYYDPETSEPTPNVLLGGGLTNRPLFRSLNPIMATDKENKEIIYLKEDTMEKKTTDSEVVEAADTKDTKKTKTDMEDSKEEDMTPEEKKKMDKEMKDKEAKKAKKADEGEVETTETTEETEVAHEETHATDEDAAKPVDEEKTETEAPEADKTEDAEGEEAKADETVEASEKKAAEAEVDSMEEELNEIADAYQEAENNPFKCQWYGYKIVGTYEDHIILVADPDCDSESWSDYAHVKYYRVDFTEDEASEKYAFGDPVLVKPDFVPQPEEEEEGKAYDLVMSAKASEKKATDTEEKTEEKTEVKTEEKVEEVEAPAEIKSEEPMEKEFSEEQLKMMELRGTKNIKCRDGVMREIKDGKIVATEEEKETVVTGDKEDETVKANDATIAIEGTTETISASEVKELRQAKEELLSKKASETIESLVFNEKIGLRMPTESKDAMVSFYKKLNESMRDEFTAILAKIPAAKIFTEVGDSGEEQDPKVAYEKMGEIMDKMMSEGLNSGEALKKAYRENPELAKLAREYKKTGKTN